MTSPAVVGSDGHRAAGNVLNFLSYALTAGSTALAIIVNPAASAAGDGVSSSWFDPYWLQHGFCASHMDSAWGNTHAVSCLVNLSASVALRLLYAKDGRNMNEQVAPMVKGFSVGTFAHGVGHLAYSFAVTRGKTADGIVEGEAGDDDVDVRIALVDVHHPTAMLVRLAVAILLAKGLLTGVMPFVTDRKWIIPFFVLLSVGGYEVLQVPRRLTFTYVFSWVTMGKIVNQVLLPKDRKGFTYFVMAAANFPIALLAVVESTFCLDMLIHLGGHAVFDAYIPVSVLILYYVVKRREGKHGKVA